MQNRFAVPSLADCQQSGNEETDSMPTRPTLTDAMNEFKVPAERPEYYAGTRAGLKKVTTSIRPEAWMQFRQLALECNMTGEALIIEAINDLFEKYDRPRIA